MKLSEIDQNLAVASELNLDGLVYRNAMEEHLRDTHFQVYQVYREKNPDIPVSLIDLDMVVPDMMLHVR